jgi:signal transduction histidine kinase
VGPRDDDTVRATRAVSPLIVVAGVLVAAETVLVVRTQPEVTYAGGSGQLLVLEVAAGLVLVGTGAVAAQRATTRTSGGLVALAGAVWLTREWASPAAGSALVFTTGLVLAGVVQALLAHAADRFPGMPRAAPLVVPLGYAVVLGLQGVAPVLFLDPRAEGCAQCTENLLLVADRGDWAQHLQRFGSWTGAAWAALAAADLLWSGWRATPARRRVAVPFAAAVSALLVVAAWGDVRAALSWTAAAQVDDRLWVIDALALMLTGPALLYDRAHARNVRVSLARLAVNLGSRRSDGGLVEALSRLVGDPSLAVLYPLPDGTLVDGRGNPTEPPPGRESTVLSRNGQPIAYLLHRPGALGDDAVMDEIGTVATMSIDHERHQALSSAHIAALRASRARIVAARDAERRRLERDLHDGAQQRLVTLALLLRLAQRGPAADDGETALLDHCSDEVTSALADLRALAHGIYPAALADEGLEAALQALSETAPLTLDTVDIEERRYSPEVESTAYFALAQLVRHCVHDAARLTATQGDHRLRFEVEVDAPAAGTLAALEDRVGALDGRLTLARRDKVATTVVMEIPCA